jgi:hypothetical protein
MMKQADIAHDGKSVQEGPSMPVQLRVFSEAEEAPRSASPPADVHVRLGDLLPLVALAHRNNYMWLQDFLDDEVAITSDLYDVLSTFQAYRPSA